MLVVSDPILNSLVTVLIGAGSFGVGAIGVWLTQRNRDQDKADQQLLERTAERASDTRAALEAWQHIVGANNKQLALQAEEIRDLRQRAETCEARERILRAEFEAFKIVVAKGIEERPGD